MTVTLGFATCMTPFSRAKDVCGKHGNYPVWLYNHGVLASGGFIYIGEAQLGHCMVHVTKNHDSNRHSYVVLGLVVMSGDTKI